MVPLYKKKKTTSNKKSSLSNQEIQYLEECAEKTVIAAFANRKPLGKPIRFYDLVLRSHRDAIGEIRKNLSRIYHILLLQGLAIIFLSIGLICALIIKN